MDVIASILYRPLVKHDIIVGKIFVSQKKRDTSGLAGLQKNFVKLLELFDRLGP